jgi:hypothetical protein
VRQIHSSKALGKKISDDKLKKISFAGQIFLTTIQNILKEHAHIDDANEKSRIVFASTTLLLSPSSTKQQPPTHQQQQQNWISLMVKGNEETLDAILSQAAETVPDMPQGQLDVTHSSDEGLASSSEDNMCAHCRVELTDVLPKENLSSSSSLVSLESLCCSACHSKWCEPCGVYIRTSGQCACCFLYGTLESCKSQPPTSAPISEYYTDGRKPHVPVPSLVSFPEIHTARRARDGSSSDTESEDEKREAKKRKRRTKQNKKPTRRVMKHGDAIGIWSRRYLCCGMDEPYKSSTMSTCRRRTWLGTLAKALKHVQDRHGMSDLHWKETDMHWICMTGNCALAAQQARHPVTSLEGMRQSFVVPKPQQWSISTHHEKKSKRSNEEDNVWERLVIEHMRDVHKVVHLSTREEVMPDDKTRHSEKRHSYTSTTNMHKCNVKEQEDHHPELPHYPNVMPHYPPYYPMQRYYHPQPQNNAPPIMDSTHTWGGPPPPFGMYYFPYPKQPPPSQYDHGNHPFQKQNVQETPVEYTSTPKEQTVATTLSNFSMPLLDEEDVMMDADKHHPLPIDV